MKNVSQKCNGMEKISTSLTDMVQSALATSNT